MRGYSATTVFSEEEIRLLEEATMLVGLVEDPEGAIRCHELARAVGEVLGLEHQDGVFGYVDHTWLWTTLPRGSSGPGALYTWKLPNILDVYAVGALPMVQLVHVANGATGHAGAYQQRSPRSDVNEERVRGLVRLFADARKERRLSGMERA